MKGTISTGHPHPNVVDLRYQGELVGAMLPVEHVQDFIKLEAQVSHLSAMAWLTCAMAMVHEHRVADGARWDDIIDALQDQAVIHGSTPQHR